VAVIVNDMSEVNIDAELVKNEGALSRTEEKLVEMSNGCICCTLREDLMLEVEKLAKENRFDYLLIESTGISEPIPVAQTFSFADEEKNIDLSKFSYIDTMVTVVDCFNFFKDFGSDETLMERKLTDMEGDYRSIVNLLVDQIEFADVIILNKTDLVSDETIGVLKAAIRKLNAEANIIDSHFGQVEPEQILNTGLFDYEKAESSAGWIQELNKEHTPETEEYGISSFVFRDKRPFHPERLWKYLNEVYPSSIIRAKGMLWIASRSADAINFSQAGGSLRVEKAGVWWASMPFIERASFSAFAQNKEFIESKWDTTFGDRNNELVFIGQEMEKEKYISDLESALLTDEELFFWQKGEAFADPFPEM
jgi:G3E family GTPase